MESWTFWDWVAYGGIIIAALLIAIDTAIAQSEHLSRHLPRILKGYVGFLPLLSLLVGGGAFAYQRTHPANILDLPPSAQEGSSFGLIQAWGANNGVFYAVVKTNREMMSESKLRKLVLIVRVPFSEIDEMTDPSLKKSQAYTILDGFMTLALPINNGVPWKVVANGVTPLEYILVEIPFMFSPDQIRTLADVEGIGGKIIAKAGTAMEILPAQASTTPPGACPPIPAQPGQPGKT
jgi:hypothetical protein